MKRKAELDKIEELRMNIKRLKTHIDALHMVLRNMLKQLTLLSRIAEEQLAKRMKN